MDYQEIMRDIASGLTGENEKDIQYLMEQMEKYKDHEFGKEIIRTCGRLISGMLPEEKVNEFADAFEKDNAEIENELDDLFSTLQSGDYNLALNKVEKLVENAEELISAGMYQNDSVSDYFCFINPMQELLYGYRHRDSEKDIRPSNFPFATIYFFYGNILFELGRYTEANVALEKAKRWNPMDADIAFEYAETYKAMGDIETFFDYTIEIFDFAYKSEDLARCYRNLGYYFIERKLWQEAIACEDYSLNFDSNTDAAYGELFYIEQTTHLEIKPAPIETMKKFSRKYGFPLEPNEDVVGLAIAYGRNSAENGNDEFAKYFLNIAYDLTHFDEVKQLLDELERKDIESKTETLSDVLCSSNNFIIPAYQRPYEWGEKEINGLTNTIYAKFCDYLENEENAQFLLFGILQFGKSENHSLSIIDGHQRITTFYILKSILAEKLGKENNLPKVINQINNVDIVNVINDKSTNYGKNKELLDKFVSGIEKENLESFKGFIDKKILFVSIFVSETASISTLLEIFDSINTTGLKLDVKDIFKIKFCDYICKNNNDKNSTLKKINDAYQRVNSLKENYSVDENVLLDTFRFYLISKINKSGDFLRMSNNKFFFDEKGFFNSPLPEELVDVDLLKVFQDISDCIFETQNYLMNNRDKNSGDLMKGCSRELLGISGYGNLKNMYFYLVFIQWINDKKINETIIENAEQLTELLWQYCSLYSASYSRIVYRVFTNIKDIYFCENSNLCDNIEGVKDGLVKTLEKENFDFAGFKSVLDKSVFDNRMKNLFLSLSYIDDCHSHIETPYNVKNAIFYSSNQESKKSLDIEHILSHSLYSDNEYVDSLGNLMFLERTINRQLGAKTKNLNEVNKQKDIEIKLDFYKKSTLQSVGNFLSNYDKNHNIENYIADRNIAKTEFLKNLYGDFYTVIDKKS